MKKMKKKPTVPDRRTDKTKENIDITVLHFG